MTAFGIQDKVQPNGESEIKVIFIARTLKYVNSILDYGFVDPGDVERARGKDGVICVMRIEGATGDLPDMPYVEFDGKKKKARMTITNRVRAEDGTWREVNKDFVFHVPRQATEMNLIVSGYPPLAVSAPAEILKELSKSDIK
jgi:hypothetical protein